MLRPAQIDQTRLAGKAAASMRRCARNGADLARAIRVDRCQPSRWMNGSRSSIAYKALAFVRDLSTGEHTSAFPFIDELWVEAMYGLLEKRSTQWLIRRWHELHDRAAFDDAKERLASHGRDRAAYREALKQEANAQLELAAVDEVLELRGYDARQFRGDGVLEVL